MKNIIRIAIFLISIVAFSLEGPYKSIYTSTEVENCKIPTGIFKDYYVPNEEDHYAGAVECEGYKNYKIFIDDTDGSSLAISDGKRVWSTMDLGHNYNEGGVPTVHAGKIEWRVANNGDVKALIYRMNSIEAISGKKYSRLFILSFDNGVPKFCGTTKTNEEARRVADNSRCAINLKVENISKKRK